MKSALHAATGITAQISTKHCHRDYSTDEHCTLPQGLPYRSALHTATGIIVQTSTAHCYRDYSTDQHCTLTIPKVHKK